MAEPLRVSVNVPASANRAVVCATVVVASRHVGAISLRHDARERRATNTISDAVAAVWLRAPGWRRTLMRRAFLVGALALFAGCSLPTGPTATDRGAVFDQLWRDVDLHYSFFDLKKINWDSLGAVYRPRALAAGTELEFANVVTEMLAQLHDPHVVLFAEGQTFVTSNIASTIFFPDLTLSKYVPQARRSPSGQLAYGFVTPGVGYIRILTFEREWSASEFDDALAWLETAKTLIIDVRDNSGGSATLSTEIAGRFANNSSTYARIRYRNGPAHRDFTGFIDRNVQPAGA